MKIPAGLALVFLAFGVLSPGIASTAQADPQTEPQAEEAIEPTWQREPLRYFEIYKPSYFLLGKPITKVQLSLKVQVLRGIPLFAGYTQLMMWDLFVESAPFRDLNYNPDIFYRFTLGGSTRRLLDVGIFEHESNGMGGSDSRSWNRVYLRYTQGRQTLQRGFWWSMKAWVPYGLDDEQSKYLPRYRGVWEIQAGLSDYFDRFFEVNELILRVYGGGSSRSNPLQGGQELTYRGKSTARKLLLPFYLQVFHGYGENLLDAEERRWGFRAGIGF